MPFVSRVLTLLLLVLGSQRPIEFYGLVKDKLGEAISYRYKTYQNYPHVPFPCLYDGLRFVTADQPKK